MTTETLPTSAPASSLAGRLLLSEHAALVFVVAYAAAVGPFVPAFGTPANLSNLLSNLLPLLVVALGQTFVLIGGGIDLSVTATIALASVLGASVMSAEGGWLAGSPLAVPAALAAMLLVGAAVGTINGLAVARLGMPPFMVTLATMLAGGGLAVWYTRSDLIRGLPDGFLALEYGGRLGVPMALPLVLALVLLAHVGLSRTLGGRWLYTVGRNPKAARICGVPVSRVIATSYVASGLCAAVGAMIYTARLETGSPDMAPPRILLDVIGAAVLGGTSLFGGRGSVVGTLYGVLFIVMIDNTLTMMSLSNFLILVVKGVVILLAALLDAARTRHTGEA